MADQYTFTNPVTQYTNENFSDRQQVGEREACSVLDEQAAWPHRPNVSVGCPDGPCFTATMPPAAHHRPRRRRTATAKITDAAVRYAPSSWPGC